jgi:hypothetical protein
LINENQNEKINTFTSLSNRVFANAQDRVITTAVPFLLVSADARAAGMADIESPLRQMLFRNNGTGKIRLCNRQTRRFYKLYPYLTNLANDISLGQLTYYNKISERSAFAGSLVILVLEKLNYVKLRQMNNFEPYLLMNLQLTVHTL